MKRRSYNSVQVLLHWLLAVSVIISLIFGKLILKNLPNGAEKITPLRVHLIIGSVIGLLVVASTLVRLVTDQPERKRSGNPLIDAMALVTHFVLRVGVIAIVASGIAMALQAGLFGSLFGHSGAALPQDFWELGARRIHAVFANLLIGLTGLHIAATAYHQLFRKDGLMARMWFHS